MKKSKKDLIIEKASELFFYKGILATSMDEIAEKVPVAKMTIYKYFHSKEGLLSEVLDRVFPSRPDIIQGIGDLQTVGEQFRTMFLYGIVTPEYQQKNSPEEI